MMHIHNGDVVAALARRSDIPGEHVAYRESLITGPIVPGDEWIERRARALAGRYGEDLLRTRTSLMEQEQRLDAAPEQGEIVLWFEHDLFCFVHLVHMLQRFGAARLSMVWSATPLSDHDERELYLLFESRAGVTPSLLQIAREVWAAYTSPDPSSMNRWIERDTPELPFLREAMSLHVSRFPSTRNGLGSVEQQALELIAAGTSDFNTLFDLLGAGVPRLGFGDAEGFKMLRDLATCAVPLLTMAGEFPKAMFMLTPAGEKVMRGDVDNLAVNDPDTWLGGVHLTKENVWRFDGKRVSR